LGGHGTHERGSGRQQNAARFAEPSQDREGGRGDHQQNQEGRRRRAAVEHRQQQESGDGDPAAPEMAPAEKSGQAATRRPRNAAANQTSFHSVTV